MRGLERQQLLRQQLLHQQLQLRQQLQHLLLTPPRSPVTGSVLFYR